MTIVEIIKLPLTGSNQADSREPKFDFYFFFAYKVPESTIVHTVRSVKGSGGSESVHPTGAPASLYADKHT